MRLLAAAACAALAIALPGQTAVPPLPIPPHGRNAQLLGTFDPGELSSGMWGYVDQATGKEYALLLSDSATRIFDCTTGTPVLRATIPGPVSGWREARTFGQYAYVVTEGGGGMQVIDLQNPDNPQLLGTVTLPGWTNTHNIGVDAERGTLWACGATPGTLVFDARANPTQPPLITTFTGFYVHDVHVQDGLAHLSEINANRYQIADVSNLPAITILGQATAPGRRFFHNVWATRDNRYSVGTNESGGGPLSIWDIRNPALPLLVAQIHPAPMTATIHNAYVRDRVVHIAYYTEGYVGIDLSDPTLPVVVSQYDTYPGTSQGFNGAWGCFPFLPSGNVYISDIQTGLYVIRPKASVVRYGTATAGGSGRKPAISGFGAGYLGNANFKVECERAAPNAPGLLLLNTGRVNLNFAGLHLNVDPFGGTPVLVSVATDAAGKAVVPAAVPAVLQMDGAVLNLQAFVYDPGGPFDMSASQGLEITLFTR